MGSWSPKSTRSMTSLSAPMIFPFMRKSNSNPSKSLEPIAQQTKTACFAGPKSHANTCCLRPQSPLNPIYPCQRTSVPTRHIDLSADFFSASGRREILRAGQMGFSISWIAVRGKCTKEIPDATGLIDASVPDECKELNMVTGAVFTSFRPHGDYCSCCRIPKAAEADANGRFCMTPWRTGD
jgi:hypothetical protein